MMMGKFDEKPCTLELNSIKVRLLISPESRPASKTLALTVEVVEMLNAEE